MPPAYGNIKALHAGKNDKGIILRLVRKYVVPDFYGGKKPESLKCIFHDDEYVKNKAATMMGTTSRFITLQTPEPQAYQVFYEYRSIGNKKRSSIMIRLTDGWSEIAEQLLLESMAMPCSSNSVTNYTIASTSFKYL